MRSSDLEEVIQRLSEMKQAVHLGSEVKWSKCSADWLPAYQTLMDEFMDLVAEGKVKVRIMFTQNVHVPVGLTKEQRQNEYLLLYYQFLKHGFGLKFSDEGLASLRLYLDKMPESREAVLEFKKHLARLGSTNQLGISIDPRQIAEVDSKKHVVMQCLDVNLGAMQFRLNDQHRQKPPGSRNRGRKTIAKEKLYRHIRQRVCDLGPRYKRFNVGITTGLHDGGVVNRWKQPYRHWLFKPSASRYDESRSKGKRK